MRLDIRVHLPNARPEWRGGKGTGMQTGRAIPRPLQAACSAFLYCILASVLSGSDLLLFGRDERILRTWTPRVRCDGSILSRNQVVPIGCDQILSAFFAAKSRIRCLGSQLLRPGSIVIRPALAKTVFIPDTRYPQGEEDQSRATRKARPHSLSWFRFHAHRAERCRSATRRP